MVYSMTELQQQAVVTIATTETYGIRRWINSVNLLYDQGHIALENYDLENAYIFFMRGFSIMIEVVKQHPHYSDILTDPLYIQLKKKTNEDVYLLLKYLAEKIQSGPYLKQPHYAYRPSHDPRNFPHYSVHHRPLFTSPSHPFIPNTLHIEPTDIIRWLKSSSPPRLLFIDVRPKHVFRKGSIRYRWILQIDPKCVMTEHSVLEYLKQEESQQRMFRERNQFDLVICYDQAQYPPVFNQLKSLISTKCMFLVDGYEGWKRSGGEIDICLPYKSPISKPQPLPTAPRKESLRYHDTNMTTPQVSAICPVPPSYAKLNRLKSYNDPTFNTQSHNIPTQETVHYQPTNPLIIGITGLKNLGNTCYMNSILQCLSATIPLARYYISGTYRHHINSTNKLGTGGVLSDAFSQLLKAMWSNTFASLSPVTFKDALIRYAPQFSGTEQQDSQEFLTFLLDGLHEDTASSQPIKEEEDIEKMPDWQASSVSWEHHILRNKSKVVDTFQGQYKSVLTCMHCKKTSTTYSTFMSLSLPVPIKKMRLSSITLYHCLDYFVKEEVLEKEDAWFCPQCKKKRRATKQLTLSRLPDILLVHLKRFSLVGQSRNKIDCMVKCPIKSLDLSGYIPSTMLTPHQQVSTLDRPSYNYDLYAVSNHYGSLSDGHYTAYIRNIHKEQWYHFDDSQFTPCEESKVMTKAAYNLFYIRSNC